MPSLGRFASADTRIPDFANPQAFNRYAYTVNNPIRLVDPSGHLFWDVVDFVFFAKSAYDFYHEPSWGNAGWLALDTVSLIPVVPSVGWIKYGDEAIEVAARVVNQVSDAGQAANQAVNAGTSLGGAGWKRIGETIDSNIVQQSFTNSCSSACGQMLLNRQGVDVAQNTLIGLAGRPTSVDALASAMNSLDSTGGQWIGGGFANTVDTVNALTNNGSWIANMKLNNSSMQHSIIVEGFSDTGHLWISDPWNGTRYMMDKSEFLNWWGGYGVFKQP